MITRTVILLFVILAFIKQANSQSYLTRPVSLLSANEAFPKDSTAKDTSRKKLNWHSPGLVALQSAVVPGLGQISNKHIWKVPLIYAGFATCIYFINFNHKEYINFRDAYRLRSDGDSMTIDIYDARHHDSNYERGIYNSEQALLRNREAYRQDRDLTIIITAAIYSANILDAYVFAHLKDFDVSDELSMRIMPVTFSNIAGRNHLTTGLRLKFK